MNTQKQYRVTWSIDVEQEDVNSPEQAIEECWKRLQDHGNDWFWEVEERGTGKKWEVDYEYALLGLEDPVVTSIYKQEDQ